MKIFSIVISLVLCIVSLASGQKQNNIWYFGGYAGIDFNSSPPSAVVGKLYASYACGSVSDPDGNLLFYTDGLTVWDRNHCVMPHGTGLMGSTFQTIGVLIEPWPDSKSKYYIFTTDASIGADVNLNYSIVDMNLNGGFGDVINESKNTLLLKHAEESITSALHSNGKDIWIITHKLLSRDYLAYLLTSTGLDTNAVISTMGAFYDNLAPGGFIKTNIRGTKLIGLSSRFDSADLFDFDPATGMLSNFYDLKPLFDPTHDFYDVEFSPNDSLIYLTDNALGTYLYQVELKSGIVTLLYYSINELLGGVKLAPDSNIYITEAEAFVDIIHEPNVPGIGCQYERGAFQLAANTFCGVDLPRYVHYSFPLDPDIKPSLGKDTLICNGDSLTLSLLNSVYYDSTNYVWSDGSSGTQLIVRQPGQYWLEVSNPCWQMRDTINVNFISCTPIVQYDLEACTAYMIDGSNMDYSEFIPTYPNSPECATVTASKVFRSPPLGNKHSCTPGVGDSVAMCISSLNSCSYAAGSQTSLIVEIQIQPAADSVIWLTGLDFYERAPFNYNWINGGTGPNNYPTKYGIRILKDGKEIFRNDNIPTSFNWTLQTFDFLNQADFRIDSSALIRIEWLPYCPTGNGADVSAWDIDEIRVLGGCVSPIHPQPIIQGQVRTKSGKPIPGVEMQLSKHSSFTEYFKTTTDASGNYSFNNLIRNQTYFLKGFKNNEIRKGISSLDLISLQKHLLGISTFSSLHPYIAADVNHSNTVTAIDLLELRKILLGINFTFPNNTSWRFGVMPQDMGGTDTSSFLETFNIESLDQDSLSVDFIGIKIGDVNGDIQIH